MEISKFKIAVKWLFGGPEAVIDYVLDVLNSFLAKSNITAHIDNAMQLANRVLKVLRGYQKWCPQKWETEYLATISAVESVCVALSDASITKDEINHVTDKFKLAYAAWMAED